MIKQQWVKNLSEPEQIALLLARQENRATLSRERARRDKVKVAAKKYGLTEEELQAMIDATGGLCDLCGESIGDKLNVDHCHDTLKVRGILCSKCNSGLGYFRDDIRLLRKAAEYLESNSGLSIVST